MGQCAGARSQPPERNHLKRKEGDAGIAKMRNGMGKGGEDIRLDARSAVHGTVCRVYMYGMVYHGLIVER